VTSIDADLNGRLMKRVTGESEEGFAYDPSGRLVDAVNRYVHELRCRFCCWALKAPAVLKSRICSERFKINRASIRMYGQSLTGPLGRCGEQVFQKMS
jgi:hypothetical protein